MHDKLSVLGANLLKETLPSIVNGTNDSISQDDTQATFASNISREDERIDWTMNAKDIHNHIRGLSPWPVGYTTMDDTNLKLYAAHIVHNKKGNQEIVETTKRQSLLRQAPDDAIALTDIQLAGKKRMLASNYLSGVQESLVGKILK